jgi:hypothetical protein
MTRKGTMTDPYPSRIIGTTMLCDRGALYSLQIIANYNSKIRAG